MNDASIELLLYRIISGKLYFFYKNEKYELRQPDISTRYESQLLYNKIIDDEKYNEWLREDNLERILIMLGLWTKDTQTILKSLEKTVEDTKVKLYEQRYISQATKDNRKKISNINNQIQSLLNKKADIFSHTLEGYASSIKNEYIICHTLYKDDKLVFDKNIKNDQNSYTLFNSIVKEINDQIIESHQFKNLARSSMWRMYWNANKTDVFHGPVSDWTFDQRTLVGMSRMYDSIYEHPECPDDEVINDDDMLDGWMIIEKRKNSSSKKQNKFEQNNPRLKKAQEVFVMAGNAQETEEVLSMNSFEAKQKMKQRAAVIDAKGTVTDLQFPDVMMDMREKSVNMQRQHRNNTRK